MNDTPIYTTVLDLWPIVAAILGVWLRMELAQSRTREQSRRNETEIGKLESKIETMNNAAHSQAVSLARIEASLSGMNNILEQLSKKIN